MLNNKKNSIVSYFKINYYNRMKIKKIAIMHPTFGYNGGAENVILATVKHLYEKYNIECCI